MKKFWYLFIAGAILVSCTQPKPLISDPGRISDIETMLSRQKELTAASLKPIWHILEKTGSPDELQALKFLFAYMPLSDLADYSPEFMKANVQKSLQARKEMPWGSSIPEEEFLHFVLPLRVNNENLDSFRLVYYNELRDRVKGMGMEAAALEINHWCHEKVNYRGTDGRTSAPMSTIRKTFGRCGEESTFTVSAMRAAGIPARQVYTPRWAHTDDNHAWVEVWVNGGWHFMGACEPDPELDMGWFSQPSQRTMLVHTRTYGKYFGPEEVLNAEERFSELNLTSRYARTKQVVVKAVKADGKPVMGATVEFKLYNYAEFYPIAVITTDSNGIAKLTTGLGDLLVWASQDKRFGYARMHVASTDTLTIVVDQENPPRETVIFDAVPPAAFKEIKHVAEDVKKVNDRRLATEDSLRGKTMSFFKDTAWVQDYAKKMSMGTDSMLRIIRLSYGNWEEMTSYLESNQGKYRHNLLALLTGISDKDLSDTRASILEDHLHNTLLPSQPDPSQAELFKHYILAPRIGLEILSPWRKFLSDKLATLRNGQPETDPAGLAEWIRKNIRIDPAANKHSRAPLTPAGVFNLRVSDPVSRDIFFVAACRTLGIPARLNPENRIPEYFNGKDWCRAGFDDAAPVPDSGTLTLTGKNDGTNPRYTLNFTLARIQNGRCQTLDFEEGKALAEFREPIRLETGNYLLTTGKRLSDGSVLSSLTFFSIEKNKSVTLPVELRKEDSALKPLGKLELQNIPLSGKEGSVLPLSSLIKDQGAVVVLMDPESEPSKHILNDISPFQKQFNTWKGSFVFATVQGNAPGSKVFGNYQLPDKTSIVSDKDGKLFEALKKLSPESNLPILVFCNPNGEVLMESSGYKIGVGEFLWQLIGRVDKAQNNAPKTSCTTP